jgi:hypothetical protein
VVRRIANYYYSRVIIITGPGRSGTSILARVYQELGFSPIKGGGGWDPAIAGGLEDAEVGQLNEQLIAELGLRSQVHRIASQARRLNTVLRHPDPRSASARSRQGGGEPQYRRGGSLSDRLARAIAGHHVRLLRWDALPQVVERHGAEMRRLAADRRVVKDPAFCLTMSAWAAAQADIDHVVVSLRSLDATAAGLLWTGHLPQWAAAVARDHVVYRVGILVAALTDYRLSYAIVRFPDFLNDPEDLYESLRFPEPVTREQVVDVVARLRDPTLVSSWT